MSLTEIERKFLVDWDAIPEELLDSKNSVTIIQGYIPTTDNTAVRARAVAGGFSSAGYLTVKGADAGATRFEAEYEIPIEDAFEIINTVCKKPAITKIRYTIPYHGMLWEVDFFADENGGLRIAEIELESEDQEFVKPDWVLEEVTGDPKYYNSSLVEHPYKEWK